MVLNFCATTISLALTHERIPDKAPLPDFLLDNIQTRSWGLTASEIVLQVSQWIKQQLDLAFIKAMMVQNWIHFQHMVFLFAG